MNWEQKLAALQAITETVLCMRKPGDWYVSATSRGIAGDGVVHGAYGNGKTPAEAVEDDWRQIVEMLPSDRYILVERGSKRHHYRWNGFMWRDER